MKNLFYFLRDCLGEVSNKIKPVLFLFALGSLAATKTLLKRKEKLSLPYQLQDERDPY